jgi:hypothetical protein
METYGTVLMAGNGRDALRDALAEIHDGWMYVCQALMERQMDESRIKQLEAQNERLRVRIESACESVDALFPGRDTPRPQMWESLAMLKENIRRAFPPEAIPYLAAWLTEQCGVDAVNAQLFRGDADAPRLSQTREAERVGRCEYLEGRVAHLEREAGARDTLIANYARIVADARELVRDASDELVHAEWVMQVGTGYYVCPPTCPACAWEKRRDRWLESAGVAECTSDDATGQDGAGKPVYAGKHTVTTDAPCHPLASAAGSMPYLDDDVPPLVGGGGE